VLQSNGDVLIGGGFPIALRPEGNVLIGGGFLIIIGVFRPYVARLYGNPAPPRLSTIQSNGFLLVSWPSTSAGFELQQNTDLTTPHWTTPPETVTDNGGTRSITVNPTPGSRFFRLYKP
jgi:hypothetical protein